MTDPLNWDLALCRQHPHVNFFPERGESNAPAKAVCNRCPIKAACLKAALELPEFDDHGVRGGLSARARREIRRARRTS